MASPAMANETLSSSSISPLQLARRVKSLRHSATIPPNPQCNMSAWFYRPSHLWMHRRWLELRGATLTYRHSPHSDVQWSVDVRECHIFAGKAAKQLIINRPKCTPLTLIAPTIQILKLWFTELKRVADVSRVFPFFCLVKTAVSHLFVAPVSHNFFDFFLYWFSIECSLFLPDFIASL